MPTYLELSREAVWVRQFTPPAMNERLLVPLRTRYGLGPAVIGAAGDNNHLYGRHRSRNWCLQSAFCTNRSYGTTDRRDQGGDGDWYRAVDIGITGQALHDACRRVDAAVRAGRLPGLAEWFGTFDGKTVVGWYQGRPSSSDPSHLWHFHGGWWTESANDAAGYDLFYKIFTGTETAPASPRLIVAAAQEDENEMPYAMGKHEKDERVFALYPSGLIRHLGGAEFAFFTEQEVPLLVSKDQAELDRWVAAAVHLQ